MKQFKTRAARAKFGEVMRDCREGPVEILRRGRTVAVVVAPWDFEEYLRLKEIAREGCVVKGVKKALARLAAGESARGLGALRPLAPYWRAKRAKSAPSPGPRPEAPESAETSDRD